MTWTIIPRFFLSRFIIEVDFFMSICGKKILLCLHSLLEIHLSFHCLCIASLILFFAMIFGGGKLTLLDSLVVPIFAKASAASLPVWFWCPATQDNSILQLFPSAFRLSIQFLTVSAYSLYFVWPFNRYTPIVKKGQSVILWSFSFSIVVFSRSTGIMSNLPINTFHTLMIYPIL